MESLRHMLTFAKELAGRDLSFSVTARGKPEKKVVRRGGKKKPIVVTTKGDRMDLGTGDLAIPLMLAVSSFNLGGAVYTFAVIAGTTISLFLLLNFVSKHRVFLPALPPLCLGGVVALLVAKAVMLFA